jgi:cephalosporin hydroxylase
MTTEAAKFQSECAANIERMEADKDFSRTNQAWVEKSIQHRYSYNFSWMGRPIIQYPQDIVAMQEIIWEVQPDLIIETGIAHGGSLILYAALLHMLGGDGRVIGIDVDIRAHNRKAIEEHPMFPRITLVEGSSIRQDTVDEVARLSKGCQKVLVVLDSNHTHAHVLEELRLYSGFVTTNSYLVVFDTLLENLPKALAGDRPWGPGNNPQTAVHEFLKSNSDFRIEKKIQEKLKITAAPDGYLKKVS